MQKLRIGVLMGGKSQEAEVSLNSGRTICDHLDSMQYDIIPIFHTADNQLYILPWTFLYRGKIKDFIHRLKTQAHAIHWDDLKQYVDFVYIAMHGRFAEDGSMQGLLEILNIPYHGSKLLASAIGMDKIIHKQILQANNINVPRGIHVTFHEINALSLENIIKKIEAAKLSCPFIVKPSAEGSSLGTSIVSDVSQLPAALIKACYVNKDFGQSVLIEEKIKGMEFSCIIITDNNTGKLMPLPPTEIVLDEDVGFFDYEQKYMPGKSLQFTPARCTPEQRVLIQNCAVKTMQVLEMSNLSRIDGFLTDKDKVVIIDPNSFSGASPASFLFKQAAEIGFTHTKLINHIIETELIQYGIKKMQTQSINYESLAETKRIAVLMGGASNEKEISLESGRNVVYKLSPHKYQPIPIFVSDNLELFRIDEKLLVTNSTVEIKKLLHPSMKIEWHELPAIADFVFIALHGGIGENGSIQGMLEIFGLPYNGSRVLASALCMDKFKSTNFLKSAGFEVPRHTLIKKQEWFDHPKEILRTIMSQFAFPLIAKPHDDGCSFLIYKINHIQELEQAITKILHTKNCVLIEEFIIGMELTVGVLGNDIPFALPPSQAVTAGSILSIEEKFLPGAGENQTPAPLPCAILDMIKTIIEKTFIALQCKGYARIDCFYQTEKQSPTKKERLVIIEVNTLPGLTPATCIFHQAAEIGLKPMDFIDKIIELGFEEHSYNTKEINIVKFAQLEKEQEHGF